MEHALYLYSTISERFTHPDTNDHLNGGIWTASFAFQELAKNGGVISDEVVNKTVDKMFVLFGCEILKIVPGG